jgi:ABC-2 type transport system ATP-binding protein
MSLPAAAQTGSRSAFPDGEDGAVIRTRNLGVSFRSKQGRVDALRDLDLSIPKSSLFVLLGPNGAGKTTLMRCITGLVRPTTGSIAVFGAVFGTASGAVSGASEGPEAQAPGRVPPESARARLARMGVLIENPGAYGRLNTREYLSFFGSFYAVPDLEARIRRLCGELGLETGAKPVAKLSQGNRQKLQLARSLLHRPDLLLWDEPTDHLDPASQRDVLAYLRGYLADSGATALVATHRLEQMETAATHFGFLARGALVAAGERDAVLEDAAAGLRARLGFSRPARPEELAWLAGGDPAWTGFAARPHGEASAESGALWEVSGPGLRGRMAGLIKALVERGLPLASAELRRSSLAEVYLRLLGPSGRADASEPKDGPEPSGPSESGG